MFSTSSTVNVPTSSGARLNRSATCGDLGNQVAGPVGVGLVVEVARVEHRVQQLFLGFEVMQQPSGSDAGLAGDLGQRRGAPAVARQEPLRDGEDPLLAVLTFGEKRVVPPCVGHRTPLTVGGPNQPSEHTVGWFARCDKGLRRLFLKVRRSRRSARAN